MRDEFDHLKKGSIIVIEYEAYFHALSRCSIISIVTESEKIQKLVKELDTTFQLASSQMVVSGASF